jgi:hypothetical protein
MVSVIDMMCLIFECQYCNSPHLPPITNAAINLTTAPSPVASPAHFNHTEIVGNGRRKKKRLVILMDVCNYFS